MAGIQNRVIEKGKRNEVSRVFHSVFHSKSVDNDAIASWRQGLNRIRQIFTVHSINHIWQSLINHFQAELSLNTHAMLVDMRRRASATQAGTVPIRPTRRVTVIMSPADRVFRRLSSSSGGPPPGSTLSPNFRGQPRRVKIFVHRVIKHVVYIVP